MELVRGEHVQELVLVVRVEVDATRLVGANRVPVRLEALLDPIREHHGTREEVDHVLAPDCLHRQDAVHAEIDDRFQEHGSRRTREGPLTEEGVVFHGRHQPCSRESLEEGGGVGPEQMRVRVRVHAAVFVQDAVSPQIRPHDRQGTLVVRFQHSWIEMLLHELTRLVVGMEDVAEHGSGMEAVVRPRSHGQTQSRPLFDVLPRPMGLVDHRRNRGNILEKRCIWRRGKKMPEEVASPILVPTTTMKESESLGDPLSRLCIQ